MIFPLISIAYESKYFVCCWKLWITQKNLGNSQRVVRMFFVVLVPFFSFLACFVLVYFKRLNLKSLMFQQLVFSRFSPFLAIILNLEAPHFSFLACVLFMRQFYISR